MSNPTFQLCPDSHPTVSRWQSSKQTVLSSSKNCSSGRLPSICDLFIHLFCIHLVVNIVLTLLHVLPRAQQGINKNPTLMILYCAPRGERQTTKEKKSVRDEYYTES